MQATLSTIRCYPLRALVGVTQVSQYVNVICCTYNEQLFEKKELTYS